ncbi:MAG: class I SAM-dependent methyltransferase [Gammaproteobacteria bacterium]
MLISNHDMLPTPSHDQAARLDFVKSLRAHLSGSVMPGNYLAYERRVEPAIRLETGASPADRRQIRPCMERDPFYRFWSALQRRSQELMWDVAIDITEPQVPALIERFKRYARDTPAGGSLSLDSGVPVPRYHAVHDIHIQPGGYHTEQVPVDDVAAGAIFETGIQAYGWGLNLGELLLGYLRSRWPEFRPGRILDIGCTIGSSTIPWARAFPGAELHAIDVAAPVLRYAHARAEALGVPIHFSQQNAEATNFASGSFDLVVSHITLHETSRKAMPRILAECRRLLKQGGLMLHFEIPRGNTPIEQFMHDWESYNNNESFARFMTDIDLPAVATEGGWRAAEVRDDRIVPAMPGTKKNYARGELSFKVLVGERGQ